MAATPQPIDTLLSVLDDDEPIQLVDYDPTWHELGRELVQQVSDRLHELPVDVAHIGSTAVPGLVAKPIIDLQIGCTPRDLDEVLTRTQQLGFEHLGHPGGPGREYLRRRTDQPANIAVVELHGRLWADNIMFRDYLRTHPAAVARYAHAKLSAAKEADALREYSALKSDTVSQIMSQARTALDTPQPAETASDHP